MKNRTYLFVIATAVAICIGLGVAPVAVANDVTVIPRPIDDTTGGDWPGTYGECFYLLPDPVRPSEDQLASDNVCFGGSLDDEGRINWGLAAGDPASSANVYVWSLTLGYVPRPGAEQWNPCVDDFKAGTFDNGDEPPGPVGTIYNPLTSELTVDDYQGCLRLSYYFAEAILKCRQQQYWFYVDGSLEATGLVEDLSWGKYAVLDVCGLDGTHNFKLEVQNTLLETCSGIPTYPNTHLSGVFVSKCEPVGTGTPGYFKKASHWPDGVQEICIGSQCFPRDDAIGYLKDNNKKGNKCVTMFRALVAAKLNVLNLTDFSCILGTIAAAEGWFEAYCGSFDLHASEEAWGDDGEALYWELDDYNNGLLCAPHRD